MSLPTAPTPGLSGIDYGAEPKSYPDGHTCNFYCRDGEHCDICWAAWDSGIAIATRAIRRSCEKHLGIVEFIRAEPAPEVPPSSQFDLKFRDQKAPPSEVAYRFWYRYCNEVRNG